MHILFLLFIFEIDLNVKSNGQLRNKIKGVDCQPSALNRINLCPSKEISMQKYAFHSFVFSSYIVQQDLQKQSMVWVIHEKDQ